MVRAMKSSGVEWIGDVPSDWIAASLKSVSSIVPGATPDSSDERNWSDGDDSIIWVTPADMDEEGLLHDSARHISPKGFFACGTQIVPYGSVVISTRAPIGKVCKAMKPLCTNQGCKCLVADSVDSSFLYWAVVGARDELTRHGRGTTFMELASYELGHIKIPVPPITEQESIAGYLDERCAAIDSAVATLEEQIDMLERYRSSVIHETVTRGLDSRVPVKRINTDWIEKIPASWELEPFKRVASVASNLVDPNLYPDMIEIDPDNIESGTGKLVDINTVGEVGAISAKQLFFKGQILYSKIRPELNKVTIAPDDGLCSADMYPIATSQCGKWLSYVMRSDLFVQQTALISYRVAMPKINVEQLAEIKIPVPPPPEQERIADYLDNRCTTIDEVIDIKSKQLDVLKKRRQSLIYEYVTGKRRVVGEN